jgi:hypothetical protein
MVGFDEFSTSFITEAGTENLSQILTTDESQSSFVEIGP